VGNGAGGGRWVKVDAELDSEMDVVQCTTWGLVQPLVGGLRTLLGGCGRST
jgi:hypothetical protein